MFEPILCSLQVEDLANHDSDWTAVLAWNDKVYADSGCDPFVAAKTVANRLRKVAETLPTQETAQ
jgi:hypothetical protein